MFIVHLIPHSCSFVMSTNGTNTKEKALEKKKCLKNGMLLINIYFILLGSNSDLTTRQSRCRNNIHSRGLLFIMTPPQGLHSYVNVAGLPLNPYLLLYHIPWFSRAALGSTDRKTQELILSWMNSSKISLMSLWQLWKKYFKGGLSSVDPRVTPMAWLWWLLKGPMCQ